MDLPLHSYEDLHYIGGSYHFTHPDRLATVGQLHGMHPAPPENCRVLELACGDGSNLLPMAYALPGSRFEGMDLAASPLETGRRLAADLGLRNVRLDAADLMHFRADAGEFDYIIAHGLYSWCPPPVREAVFALCARHLAPQGIAFISFNAHPGYHFHEQQREMMLYHLDQVPPVADPVQRARHAVSILDFVAQAQAKASPYKELLKDGAARYNTAIDGGSKGVAWFMHDLLDQINQPFYFHRFVADAATHGLQFLSDVDIHLPQMLPFPEAAIQGIGNLCGDDVLAWEQYIDFLMCTPFRRVLLCRAGTTLDRTYGPARFDGLHAAGDLRVVPNEPGTPGEGTATTFRTGRGQVSVNHPAARRTLQMLGEVYPRTIPFEELVAATAPDGGSSEDLADLLLRMHVGEIIELLPRPRMAARLDDGKPLTASALARAQAARGLPQITLRHHTLVLESALLRLLQLLDGSRDRAGLRQAMHEWIESGQAAAERQQTVQATGKVWPTPSLDTLDQDLDNALGLFNRLGLLLP